MGIHLSTCANQEYDANADLPIKYQPKVDGWDIQIMAYFRKVLPKEAKSKIKNRRLDGNKLKRAMAKINSRNGNKIFDTTASQVTQLDQKKLNHITKRSVGGVKRNSQLL